MYYVGAELHSVILPISTTNQQNVNVSSLLDGNIDIHDDTQTFSLISNVNVMGLNESIGSARSGNGYKIE